MHWPACVNSQKFATALIFPNMETLRNWAESKDMDASISDDALLSEASVQSTFENLVDDANEGADHWCQVKRFHLIAESMTVENKLLTPTMKVVRRKVNEVYGGDIDAMYAGSGNGAVEVVAG